LIIACRRVRCGSSVYVQRKWSSSFFGGADAAALFSDLAGAAPLFVGFAGGMVAVATEDRIVAVWGVQRVRRENVVRTIGDFEVRVSAAV